MVGTHRHQDGALSAVNRIKAEPTRWSFFAAVRMLQALRGDRPGVGHPASVHFSDDVVRFQQEPCLAFTPCEVLEVREDGPEDLDTTAEDTVTVAGVGWFEAEMFEAMDEAAATLRVVVWESGPNADTVSNIARHEGARVYLERTPEHPIAEEHAFSIAPRSFVLSQPFFGFFGPNGPLPQHLTMLAMNQKGEGRRRLLAEFCDIFQNRMTALMYRGWVSANPAYCRDLEKDDPFKRYVDALYGAAPDGFSDRTALPDDTRRYLAGWFAAGPPSIEKIIAVCSTVIDAKVYAEPFVGEWLTMPSESCSRLCVRSEGPAARTSRRHTGQPARLGENVILGRKSYSVQSRMRLRTEPLDLAHYRALLPDGPLFAKLKGALTNMANLDLAIEFRPTLREAEIPRLAAGNGKDKYGGNAPPSIRLGYDSWIPGERGRRDGNEFYVLCGALEAPARD